MHAGFPNKQETESDLWIWASHNGIAGGHRGVLCSSDISLLRTSSNFDRHFTLGCPPFHWLVNGEPVLTPSQKPKNIDLQYLCTCYASSFSYGKSAWNFPFEKKSIHQQDSGEPMGNLYTARGSDRDCVFVKQVHFSYSESPWTSPIEWTSLHRRTYSVERPWGILSLFTTCIQLQIHPARDWHRHNVYSSFFFFFIFIFFFSRSFFLQWITADPSPWGNFTPPTK